MEPLNMTLVRVTALSEHPVSESYSLYKQLAEWNKVPVFGRQVYVQVAMANYNLATESRTTDGTDKTYFVKFEPEPSTGPCLTCRLCPWYTGDKRVCSLTREEVDHGNCVPDDCPRRW